MEEKRHRAYCPDCGAEIMVDVDTHGNGYGACYGCRNDMKTFEPDEIFPLDEGEVGDDE